VHLGPCCFHHMRFRLLLAVLMTSAACTPRAPVGVVPPVPAPAPSPGARPPADINTAEDLIAAMYNRYGSKWYCNLTFVQKSTYLRPDSTTSRVETWYEALVIPGRLRIDLGEPARGNGVLYRGDSAYSFQGGRMADRRKARNPLLILGFDVYGQPPARTLEQLRAEGINTAVFRADTLNGGHAFVVGAAAGDSTSNQFWIDANRMLFLRLLMTPQGRPTQDIRFEKYVQHDGGWVAEEVRMYSGGRLFFFEEYSNVRVNVRLNDDLFIPEKWTSARHWYQP
jgi:hypothetical protein